MTKHRKWADELDCYMRYRASREGVGYDLSPQFFEDHPAVCYFGVIVRNGRLVEDEQNPSAFAAWRALQ
jgi:hypothetical protein